MKLLLTNALLAFAIAVTAQVHNEIVVYARPSTNLKVLGNFDNRPTGTFTLDVNAVLDVNGDVNNDGTMTFENDASLLRGSLSPDGGSGTYNVKRQGSTGNRYNHWSSPVVTSGFVPGNPSYSYNEANGTQWDGDDQPADPGWSYPTVYNGNMTPGDGYTGMGAGLATFSDNQLNNGTLTTPLHVATYDASYTSTTGGTPFNLVGNPYPSALDAWSLVNDVSNGNIHGSLYFWDDDGTGGTGYTYNDYAVWNASGGLPAVATAGGGFNVPNGVIPTGQGFMVLNETANMLTFKNSMRVANSSTNHFFRMNEETSRLWFSVNGSGVFNQILVALNEEATDDEDRLYDAIKARGNLDVSLSARDNGQDYAILAFPPPTSDRMIPLTLKITSSGNHSFKADKMEGYQDFDVYFNDTELNTNVLLQEGTSIPVQLLAGEYENRFYLNFVANAITGIGSTNENDLFAYAANGFLHVGCTGCETNATIELLDMSGRLILSKADAQFINGNAVISLNGISTGVYVVRITTEDQVLSQKIINQ